MFSISIFARASIGLGLAACAACAGIHPKAGDAAAPQAFYTVTAEIALARHQPRVAALQYAAAAATETNVTLLERATQVAADSLQPSVAEKVAARWIQVEPRSLEAQRAAARAALALHKIDQAATHYRVVLASSPIGTDAERFWRAPARGSFGVVLSVLGGGFAHAGVYHSARGRSGGGSTQF